MQTNVRDKKGDDLKSKVETQIRPISDYFIRQQLIIQAKSVNKINQTHVKILIESDTDRSKFQYFLGS